MKLKILAISLLIFSSISIAQTGTISGYVNDKQSGEPLLGANIVIAAAPLGAATDKNGFYKIKNIPIGIYKVRVSYIGYNNLEFDSISVKKNKNFRLDVKLLSDTNSVISNRYQLTPTLPIIPGPNINGFRYPIPPPDTIKSPAKPENEMLK